MTEEQRARLWFARWLLRVIYWEIRREQLLQRWLWEQRLLEIRYRRRLPAARRGRMPREFEISDAPGGGPEGFPPLGDILKYGDIITRVILAVKSAEALAVGGKMDLDEIKFRARGAEYLLDLGTLSRTK